MDYQDTLDLKEVGFPIKETLTFDGIPILPDLPNGKVIFKNLITPTLSELIRECNPEKADNMGLEIISNGWQAWYDYEGYIEHNSSFKEKDDTFSVHLNTFGKTPEEAVKNLYISLNKK